MIAGATPKEITSASESNSTPNWLVLPVIRATRPSSISTMTASPMSGAAFSRSPSIA